AGGQSTVGTPSTGRPRHMSPALAIVETVAYLPAPILEPSVDEPVRQLCPYCDTPTLHAIVNDRHIIADIHEWEPRAACGSCLHTRRAHPQLGLVNCARCADTGYVGMKRPAGWMLAIDMAWGDVIHVRVIGSRTD